MGYLRLELAEIPAAGRAYTFAKAPVQGRFVCVSLELDCLHALLIVVVFAAVHRVGRAGAHIVFHDWHVRVLHRTQEWLGCVVLRLILVQISDSHGHLVSPQARLAS